MIMDKLFKFTFGLFVAACVLCAVVTAVKIVGAQDFYPAPGFTVACWSKPDKLVLIVTANEPEHYKFSTYPVSAVTNIPAELDTHYGKYVLGWLDTTNGITEVHFTVSAGNDGLLDLRTDYMPFCDHDFQEPAPEPETTPEPEPIVTNVCPASSIDQSTGKVYCYEPQPNGIVPIPPALNYTGEN